jgi:hypothetical protein
MSWNLEASTSRKPQGLSRAVQACNFKKGIPITSHTCFSPITCQTNTVKMQRYTPNHTQPRSLKGWVVTSTPRKLYPRNETRYPLYVKVGGPHGQSRWLQKISPRPGFEPQTVRPVASYFTDWATPVALRKDSRFIKSRPFKCRMNWTFFVMFVMGIIQLGGTSVVHFANSATFIR